MKKTLIIFLIIMFTLLVAFFLIKPQITGHSISPSEYSFTRAMCNENNYCQDYKIDCYHEKIIRIKSITGASVQHLPDWEDPREKIDIEDLCKTPLSSKFSVPIPRLLSPVKKVKIFKNITSFEH